MPGGAVVSGYRIVAAMLEGLAGWIDDELAGGVPPKWVARQAAAAARYIAGLARSAGDEEDGQ
jgi:hypothetical protein